MKTQKITDVIILFREANFSLRERKDQCSKDFIRSLGKSQKGCGFFMSCSLQATLQIPYDKVLIDSLRQSKS